MEKCRQFGGPWLALELIKTLGLDTFLRETIPSGREDVPWSVTVLVLVIARLCDPSSELSIAENFIRKTALSDLLGLPEDKVYDNRLYRALDKLLPHKAELEVFLKEKPAAFRIHKSDLSIRPIWHQKEERVLAHILVCFLAYVLWKTLAALCQRAGLGNEPQRVL